MSTVNSLLDTALKLPTDERARLAAELIASLHEEADADAEVSWAAEIERRAAQVESGEVATISWDEVRARIRTGLTKR